MQFSRSKSRQIIAIASMLASGLAMAGGNHAGGHHDSPIGEPGVASKVSRTIQVDMINGMRFIPSDIQVKQGETIRFVLKNTDSVKHEFSLGTKQELLEH
jgi:uncharacterized cupredoxin-like copper-binding protein